MNSTVKQVIRLTPKTANSREVLEGAFALLTDFTEREYPNHVCRIYLDKGTTSVVAEGHLAPPNIKKQNARAKKRINMGQ